MVAHLLAQDHQISEGGDGVGRSLDYQGFVSNPAPFAAPLINTNVTKEYYVTQGATFTFTPTLTNQPPYYHYWLDISPDEATINPLTGAVTLNTTLLPQIAGVIPNQSMYVQIVCSNAAGYSMLTLIVHVGKTSGQIKRVGAGEANATIRAGQLAMSGGDTLIIRSGTYQGSENQVRFGGGGANYYFPGGTAQTPTQIMAEVPGDWIMDGQTARQMFWVQGHHLQAEFPGTDNGAVVGSNQQHIWVHGMYDKDSTGDMRWQHCYRVQFRECFKGHGHVYTGTHGVSGIHSSESTFIVYQGCYNYGYARYGQANYQAESHAIRRGVAKYCAYYGTEPKETGFTFYRANLCRAQNCWVIDSYGENTKWWTAVNDVNYRNAFLIANTGYGDYAVDNAFQRCGTVNVNNGGFDGEEPAGTTAHLTVTDFVAVNPTPIAGVSGGSGFSNGRALLTVNGLSVINGNFTQNNQGVNLMNIGGAMALSNVLFDITGLHANFVRLINSWGTGAATIDNFSANGIIISIAETPGEATNRDDQEATAANGLMYPIRQEEGSYLRTNNLGADNLDFCIGRQGCYTDDVDAETVTTIPVLPFKGQRKAMAIWGATNWTGPNSEVGLGGSATRLGNNGVADGTDSPADYILASMGNPVFPLCVNCVSTAATTVRVSWEHPYPKHHDNVAAYFIYAKNVTDSGAWIKVGTVDRFTNVFSSAGLTVAKLYNFRIRSIYIDGRISGPSYEKTCQL